MHVFSSILRDLDNLGQYAAAEENLYVILFPIVNLNLNKHLIWFRDGFRNFDLWEHHI